MARSAADRPLGCASKSIYMSHALVIRGATLIMPKLTNFPRLMVDGYDAPQLPLVLAVAVNLVLVFSVILISLIVYRTVEAPARAASRRLVLSKTVLPVTTY